jgi:hypothetical protein
MRLSEAIRLGAMMKPQAFGASFHDGRTCALGAALDAIGRVRECYLNAPDYWAMLVNYVAEPVTGEMCLVLSAIRELNDQHRWTREQIADWVETIEARSTETTTAPVADSAEILTVGNR